MSSKDISGEPYKVIYFVTSVVKDHSHPSRTWSFWDTKEKAIEEGIFGWSGAEPLYESGYYDYIVVEGNILNHPMPCGFLDTDNDPQVWFKFVPEECDKLEGEDIRKSIVRLDETPEEFKHVIGFF